MIEIIVPTPGESISEVEIGSWLVENGSWVELDQEIASIESEKATLELTAPGEGTIEILAQAGEAVKVGAVIGRITIPTREHAPSESAIPTREPTPSESAIPTREHAPLAKSTPVARKIMKKQDLNIDDIINGLKRISRKEVEMVVASREELQTERTIQKTRMSLLRRKLSERLVAVKQETAMLTTFNEIDMAAVMELRNRYKTAFQNKHGVKLGFMSFFSMAVAKSLLAFPQINSQIDGENIISFNYTDIGIAMQTPKGLMVPVIRDIQLKGLAEIESDIAHLAEKAKNNKISIDELQGGTFSITNGGVFGSLLSTPILNPPQSAILGMHNIVERPIAEKGQVVIRPMMNVALSYDHRIVDGKDSVGFLVSVKEMIENPFKLLDPLGDPEKSLFAL
ncbi:MAG: 2-oxoglutarate dehydrogenase complex dihydrolipoyllysine-residue succinyltransferase [Bacteroidota bacterium]|nr:2-oxoglutarate dehydrogenase complex dihydrolipoyllysine-residue succinyltransferase [Bacteroidota bacterium]